MLNKKNIFHIDERIIEVIQNHVLILILSKDLIYHHIQQQEKDLKFPLELLYFFDIVELVQTFLIVQNLLKVSLIYYQYQIVIVNLYQLNQLKNMLLIEVN